MRQGKTSIVKPPRTSARTVTQVAVVALALLIAPAATTTATADGPATAEAAKKKHKKKKKRKKGRPAPAAPAQPAPCAGDALEPDDTMAQAFGLPFPSGSGTLSRSLCPGDADFFRVTIPAGAGFRFEVAPAAGLDAAVDLYGPTAQTVNDQGPGGIEYANYTNFSGSEPIVVFAAVTVPPSSPTQQGTYTIQGYEVH